MSGSIRRRGTATRTNSPAASGSASRSPARWCLNRPSSCSNARPPGLEPALLVLGEAASALDMLIQAQMVDLLRDLQKRRDLTYLFISHDLRVVAALSSRLIVMRHGQVVEAGDAAELFRNPKSDYTRALFAAAFNLDTAPAGVVAE